MPRKISFLVLALAAVLFMGQGCITFQKSASEGGFLRSPDRGVTWEKKGGVLSLGDAQTLAKVNVLGIESDPSDANTLYLTTSSGVFSTYNGGESWQRLQGLGSAVVKNIAVDPKDKCNLFAAVGKQMYKSTDCGRSFGKPVYDDPRADNLINDIEVDSFNSKIVYAGTAKGDVLKSLDGGTSLKIIKRFDNEVIQLAIDQKNDTRIVYAGTKNKGVWRTADAGGTWESSEKALQKFSGAMEFRSMVYHKDRLILATKYGLLKATMGDVPLFFLTDTDKVSEVVSTGTITATGWANWEPLNLLTAPGTAVISALAINPKNADEIYYGAESTLYHTKDGGATWVAAELPIPSRATALGVNPEKADIVYLGLTQFEK